MPSQNKRGASPSGLPGPAKKPATRGRTTSSTTTASSSRSRSPSSSSRGRSASPARRGRNRSTSSSTPPPPPPPPPPVPRPPPRMTPTLLFSLLMASQVLDAFDLTVIAHCSRELKRAVDDAWARIRTGGDPTTVLSSVTRPVNDPKLNEATHGPYASVAKAGGCVACGAVTRYLHPVDGSLLCSDCGSKAEVAGIWSPLFRFKMTNKYGAYMNFGVDLNSDLRLLLRYATRKAVWSAPEKKLVWSHKYSPAVAPSAKEARPQAWDSVVPRPPTDLYASARYDVFLQRDVVCLILERYGGPALVRERLRNRDLGLLNPLKPDE